MTDRPQATILTGALVLLEAFRPTARLRWRRPPYTTTKPDVLEQAWVGDQGSVEWKPVPVEVVPDER